MQISNVEKISHHYWRVTFERDGDSVTKAVRLGDCERACYRASQYDGQFMLSLQRAAREADRDFAYRKHGESFREHCEFKSSFFDLMPKSELAKLSLMNQE